MDKNRYRKVMLENVLELMIIDAITSGRETVDARYLYKPYKPRNEDEEVFLTTCEIPLTFICSICSPWRDYPVQSREMIHQGEYENHINIMINQSNLWVWHYNEYYDNKSASEFGIIIADSFDEAVETIHIMYKSYTTICNFAVLRYGNADDSFEHMPRIENDKDYERMINMASSLISEFGPYMLLKEDKKEEQEMEDNGKELIAEENQDDNVNEDKPTVSSDNKDLLTIFALTKESGITTIAANGRSYIIDLAKWLEVKEFNVRDVSEILNLGIVVPSPNDAALEGVLISDLYLVYKSPIITDKDFVLVVASSKDQALRVVNTRWICGKVGLTNFFSNHSEDQSLTIFNLKDIYNLYIWWCISPKDVPDKPIVIRAMNTFGEYVVFATDPYGGTPVVNMDRLWVYTLYPMTDGKNIGYVVANNIDEAWDIIKRYDLYVKAGGVFIGIGNTEYSTPAQSMVLTNLATKEKCLNFGDKFIETTNVHEIYEEVPKEEANNEPVKEDILSLYRWVISRNEGSDIRVGVAIYESDNINGVSDLLHKKFPPTGLKVVYNIKEVIKLPGLVGIESMIYDFMSVSRDLHFEDADINDLK